VGNIGIATWAMGREKNFKKRENSDRKEREKKVKGIKRTAQNYPTARRTLGRFPRHLAGRTNTCVQKLGARDFQRLSYTLSYQKTTPQH
jgi:hypothetical protein